MNGKVFLLIFLLLLPLVPIFFVLTGRPIPFISAKKNAALSITSTPSAKVYLNDILQGNTPFDKEDLKSQEYKVKLEPESGLPGWEGRVNLLAGLKTSLNWEFDQNEEFSSGIILTLEKITDQETGSLTVVTTPENSVVILNGEPRGFSSMTINNLKPGSHILNITSTGYKEKTQEIKLISGYRTNANVKLAKAQEKEEPKEEEKEKEATASASKKTTTEKTEDKEATISSGLKTAMERPYVKIKETGTGWLRVRSEPVQKTDNSNEVAKVEVGGIYKFLEETDNGWYKIEYEKGKSGWISGRYTEKFE